MTTMQIDRTDIARRDKQVSACSDRFWAKVERTDDCWLWNASTNKYGYGQFFHDGRPVKAHRFAYQLLRGPIPAGLELDHLCRVRRCVRPSHLEAVTHRENLLRGDTFQARNARATHCAHGHAFDYANTKVAASGRRRCRACDRDYHRRRAAA